MPNQGKPSQQNKPNSGKATPAKAVASGEDLFAKKCAPCHGVKGVGGAGFPKPLTGTKTATDLGIYVAKSMPPGSKTPPDEANKIAAYMHEAFYSPIAQERIRPPKISLSRLTIKQYRNALADLVGPEHAALTGEGGGLTGQYFKNRPWDQPNKLINRVDPVVNFDFGNKGPSDQPFDLHNFSIVWSGSLIAPETGVYDFIVNSNQGTTLRVNDMDKPIIDGRVRSANEKEFRGSVFLIGGRNYPILFEFTKVTTGVNDEAKKKTIPPGPAFVQLKWKRPKLGEEIIPSEYLSAAWNAKTYITETAFPADDRSIGYERGTSVSKEWDDATTYAALEVADLMTRKFAEYSGIKPDAADRPQQTKQWLKNFLGRAFRSPLTPEQEKVYIDKQFEGQPNLEAGIKRTLVLGFKSPRFLYREVGNRTEPDAIAAEMAFAMWDSIPDSNLTNAVRAGQLKNAEGVNQQAWRMVHDSKTWTKVRDFLMMWLKVDEVPDIVKDSKAFPNFDINTVTDLRTSLDLFLKDAAWSEKGSYQQLLLSKNQFLNGRLSKLYGGGLAEGAPFQMVTQPERTGVLTNPYLLSKFAYLEGSSPIHRGVLIARSMMGRILAPPPVAVAPVAASLHPNLTTRERVTMQTKAEACTGCHSLINPLGFTLERFDAIGRIRNSDNNKSVDTNGTYITPGGQVVTFNGPEELANFIANSEEAQSAFVEKLFQHMTKQPIRAYGKQTLPNLVDSFKKNNFNIKALVVSIVLLATTEPTKS